MVMKKQLAGIALIGVLMIAGSASANWGRGAGGYPGGIGCPQQSGMMFQQLDEETRGKITVFQKENQDLRKEMVMKQAEKRALMRQEQPDPQAVARVAGELFDLHTSLQEKAEIAGIAQFIGHGRQAMAGPGRQGHGRKGQGGKPCWGGMQNPELQVEPVPQQ
jgi:Spy/CpxP family protein refolding chaperone